MRRRDIGLFWEDGVWRLHVIFDVMDSIYRR